MTGQKDILIENPVAVENFVNFSVPQVPPNEQKHQYIDRQNEFSDLFAHLVCFSILENNHWFLQVFHTGS